MDAKRFRSWIWLVLALFVTGCASAPAPSASTPSTGSPSPAAPTAPAQSPAPAPARPPASGEIEFFFPESPGLKEGFAGVVEAYKAKNPNVNVKVRTVPFGQYANQLKVMWASNTVADVVLPGGPDIRNYQVNGALLSLEAILPASKYGDFIEAGINAVVQEGKPYGYPWRESAQAMFYNKDHFELAGIKAPTKLEEAWTWEQWLTNIQKVTAAVEAKQGGKTWGLVYLSNPPDPSAGDYWYNPIIRTAGAKGSPTFKGLADDGVTASGYLNTPEALKAFQFFQDLFVKHKLAPQAEVPDAFGTGKASTMISFVQTGTTLRNFPNLKWGVMPMPYHVTPMSHTGGQTLAISAKSKNPNAALEFVEFAGSEEGLLAFFKASGSFITARKSLFAKKEHFPDEYQQLFLEVLQKWGVPRPATPAYPLYNNTLGKLFRDIALGANVTQAVNAAAKELDAQLKEYK